MIGFALFGCGRIGRMHASNLHAHPGAELVACYDVAGPAAAAVGTELGASQAQSVDEALANPRVRAVFIASSTDTHVDLIARSVQAGKAVLCEKPVDLDIARVDACWLARFLAGEITEVQAMGANLIDPAIQAQGDIDAAMVVMRAASGALVHVNNSRRCAYGYDQRIEAFGEAGMLQALNQHPTTVEAWGGGRTRAADPVQDFFIARYADAYRAELDHFIDCVNTGAAPLAGFAEGREALRLADAALDSMRSGRAVRLA